jgi:hypothetical protein
MITIRWKIIALALNERRTLCSTCTWGMTRSGYQSGEEEVFCRLTVPNTLVSFAVSRCTGYVDGRASESSTSARRMGFISAVEESEAKQSSGFPAPKRPTGGLCRLVR